MPRRAPGRSSVAPLRCRLVRRLNLPYLNQGPYGECPGNGRLPLFSNSILLQRYELDCWVHHVVGEAPPMIGTDRRLNSDQQAIPLNIWVEAKPHFLNRLDPDQENLKASARRQQARDRIRLGTQSHANSHQAPLSASSWHQGPAAFRSTSWPLRWTIHRSYPQAQTS